jgi:hypothetical protein
MVSKMCFVLCALSFESRDCSGDVNDDGTSPRITLTEVGNIGRFVAAACELPGRSWKENMSMVGETLTVAQVTQAIEGVTGHNLRR